MNVTGTLTRPGEGDQVVQPGIHGVVIALIRDAVRPTLTIGAADKEFLDAGIPPNCDAISASDTDGGGTSQLDVGSRS